MKFAPGEQTAGFEGPEVEIFCVAFDVGVFVAEVFNSAAGTKKV